MSTGLPQAWRWLLSIKSSLFGAMAAAQGEAVGSSVSLGWGDGRVENSGPLLFVYGSSSCREQRRGRRFAGGAAEEGVNREQHNGADRDKLRTKPGKRLIPFITGKHKVMQTGIKLFKVVVASWVSQAST